MSDDFKDFDAELDDELNGENPDGDEEPQDEPVLPEEARPRWSPSGPCFRAEMATEEQMFCVDGQMVPASQVSAEVVDPDSMNFLLAKQKEILEPDPEGAVPVGGGYRAPAFEELEEVLEQEMSCPFCGEPFTEQDADPHDLGQLVYYGLDEKGHRRVWHWACLALKMLILAKGHPEKAAETFHVNIRDLRAIKSSYRCVPWGRLGFRVPGTEGGKQ